MKVQKLDLKVQKLDLEAQKLDFKAQKLDFSAFQLSGVGWICAQKKSLLGYQNSFCPKINFMHFKQVLKIFKILLFC